MAFLCALVFFIIIIRKNWVIDLMVSNEPPIRPYGSVLYDSGVALAPPAPLGRSTAPCWVIKNKARAARK